MVVASRRVSYILPSPTETPPLLQLPPLGQSRQGQTVPTLLPKIDSNATTPNGSVTLKSKNPFLSIPTPPPTSTSTTSEPKHPRHCLGVTSLVLDTSTVLENHQSPGGILYSGGRDGLVAIKMEKRSRSATRNRRRSPYKTAAPIITRTRN
jgi:WD repeat-containing protein 48